MRQASKAAWTAFAIAALLLAAPAAAQDDPAQADDRRWSALDLTLESACVVTLAIDWLQTRPMNDEELNPLLGRHPSRTAVDVYFAGSALGHLAIAALLPRPWRTIWQATVVGMEIGVVSRNYFAGIKLGF